MSLDSRRPLLVFLRALFSLALLVALFGIARSLRSGDPMATLLAVALTFLFAALTRAPELLEEQPASPPSAGWLQVYRLALVLLVVYAVLALFL